MRCSKKTFDNARTRLNWPYCHWTHWWNCGFGSGFLPWAPGTWGSLLGLLLMVFLYRNPLVFSFTTSAALLLSLWSIPKTTAFLGDHDPKSVVCDEVVGQWIAGLIMWPCLFKGWGVWLICFIKQCCYYLPL